ncbi:Peptidase, partial [Oryctes borbonicus]
MDFNHVMRRDDEYMTDDGCCSCWKRRTIMERRLVIVTAITTIVMLSLLVTLFVLHSDRYVVCDSANCVRAANEILSYVDGEIAPCVDFYQFACGNFFRDTNSDDDKSSSMKEIMDNILINQIREMIELAIKKDDKPSVAKTKAFYRGCMNESGVDSHTLKIMRDILKDIGGWPTIDANWKESDFEWNRATHKLRRLGYTFDLFLSIEIGINNNQEDRHIVEIKPPRSHRLELNDRFRDLYLSYITDISVMLGAPKNRAEREAKDVLEFQEGLRKVIKRSEERNKNEEHVFSPRTISELHYEIPTVPWFDYINQTLQFPGTQIAANEVINLPDMVYIKELLSLLRRAQKRIQANFISWRFVQDFIEYLPKSFRRRRQKYVEMTNSYREKSRWEFCLKSVEDVMPFTLKDLYVQAFITEDLKENVRSMTEIIRRRFDKRIKKFDWLDERGIENAKEKIASVINFVADYDHDEYAYIEAAYKNIEIHEDRFLLSLLQLRRIKKDLEYGRINDPVTHEREDRNRMYNFRENRLVIPVDYLHGIYYDIYRPNYMNYAALGAIIARELSNMFLEGRNYDVRGNQLEWTTSESLVNYYKKIKCHGEQFATFYVPEIKKIVNASLLQMEDISEVAGMRFAYDAYVFWSSNNDLEPNIPGLNYTQAQIFWITTVLQQCARETSEETERILHSDN